MEKMSKDNSANDTIARPYLSTTSGTTRKPMACGLWNKALGLASSAGPELVDYVEHHKRNQDSGQAIGGEQLKYHNKPISGGIGTSADLYGQLELYANREDWDKVAEDQIRLQRLVLSGEAAKLKASNKLREEVIELAA